MTKKQKKTLARIVTCGLWFAAAGLLGAADSLPRWGAFLVYLLPYLLIGHDVLWRALRNIRRGHVFDENFLMAVATIAAFAIGEYAEALAVMLFYQVGELFQSYAVGRSRASIAEMMRIAPDHANLEGPGGELSQVDPEEVEVGAVIVVRPGERIPLDGTVLEGESFVDTASLTGESVPRRTFPGERVVSGCVNGEGTLRVCVEKPYEDSTVARILELVEDAGSRKARLENFITRFARYYTPAVTVGAALLAVLPPLALLLAGQDPAWASWVSRACVFLIVSCPCALVISVPLGFFGGIGAASRIGVLVKGSNYLEAIAGATVFAMDKTGTLTAGTFRVTEVLPAEDGAGAAEDLRAALLTLAALAEQYSSHPIARSIREAAQGSGLEEGRVTEVRERPGRGVSCLLDGRPLFVGSAAFLSEEGAAADNITDVIQKSGATVVHVAYDGYYRGALAIADEIKPQAKEALGGLRRRGARRIVLLTGDRQEAARAVADAVGADEVRSGLLPADKVAAVEELLAAKKGQEQVAFVGDGINDAPVLIRADVGIAMGGMGSDAAIEAADIVLMDDDVGKIPRVMGIGRKTMGIVRQNVAFALGVKLLVLALGALGLAGMWLAVFADVGVAVLAILNSMRALKEPRVL